ncbi:MAG: Uma2 family endonuclease [Aquifex sp.]|nr:MAG: Uma2 family endonuclease [Aquifex sp.]
MGMKVKEKSALSSEERRRLLNLLTYEKVNGKPIYYRDYKKVLKGELPPEAVMGSSELQAVIIAIILKYLFKTLPDDYIILTNELGFIYAPKSFRSLDIAVYKKKDLLKPQDKYTKKTPIVVIEIDTKADLSRYKNFEEYMYEKTKDLLDSGIEKVIWYITKVKKVLIAQRQKDWITKDWVSDVEVLEGVKLNLEKLLKEEGIEI